MGLSSAAQSVWAKSSRTDDAWMPLYRHLEDTAAIAGHVWDSWLPRGVQRVVSEQLPHGDDDGRALLCWLAGVHDVGKATPAFAVQVEDTAPHLTGLMRDCGLDMPRRLAERSSVRHELAGQYILERWLGERGWSDKRAVTSVAVVVGGHHGAPPEPGAVRMAKRRPDLVGEDLWTQVQTELVEHMTAVTGVQQRLAGWSRAPLPYTAQVLLTAAVIVSDWLASDETLFPYQEPLDSEARAARAWQAVDLPRPWQPLPPPTDDAALFAGRFTLPPGGVLRPVQEAALSAARGVPAPSLLVVEAPMGVGKTEAALAAAEVLAHRFGAGGVFVALPTMATSDAMFARVRRWVERLPSADEDVDLSLFLAHGKAALNREASTLWRSSGPSAIAQDEDEDAGALAPHAVAVAHSWLRGRKKGPLSAVVVGTIDQVLFAGLRTKHLALRHLALAGKVVVIDEVHAVDVFMGRYLERVLHWLGAYAVPAVLLSATLPAHQRRALVAAYDSGRAALTGGRPEAGRYDAVEGDIGYPVVTSTTGGAPQVRVVPGGSRRQEVVIERLADDDESLVAALEEALGGGGCAGLVRNTVRRAQETYVLLRERLSCEVVLLHSRFLAVDRAEREDDLRRRLGPPGAGSERPERLVVVGTQVIEQSLDIDFDLLVTDLAPVDLVLQRVGRLHRHVRGPDEGDRPERLRRPRCLVTGVEDWTSAPPSVVAGSRTVYGASALIRSLVAMGQVLDRGHLVLPDDIAPLVQHAYRDDLAPPAAWEGAFAVAEEQRARKEADQQERADVFRLGPVQPLGGSLVGWVSASAGEADDSPAGQAQVRDSEDTLEVVVVQRVDGEVRLLPWATRYGGRAIPTEGRPDDAVAREVATCTVRLPVHVTGHGRGDRAVAALERSWHPGWQDSPWLSGQLVLELDGDLRATLPGTQLDYDRDRGLLVTSLREDR